MCKKIEVRDARKDVVLLENWAHELSNSFICSSPLSWKKIIKKKKDLCGWAEIAADFLGNFASGNIHIYKFTAILWCDVISLWTSLVISQIQ